MIKRNEIDVHPCPTYLEQKRNETLRDMGKVDQMFTKCEQVNMACSAITNS